MDDIEAMLDVAGEQLRQLRAGYEAFLNAKAVTAAMRVQIKNIVENQRAALDHFAYLATESYGKKGSKTYYPFAWTDANFGGLFERHMPGVAQVRPDIRAAVRQYQPYQPGCAWLDRLNDVTNENKHRQLSAQTCIEHPRKQDGGITWAPGVTFATGVRINDHPIDPVTQRTVATFDVIYVDWVFDAGQVSVLGLLIEIQENLPKVMAHLRQSPTFDNRRRTGSASS